MQPSQSDIQREFEALRDIRRRSTTQGGPGALILDPDLPTQPGVSGSKQSPLSPTSPTYWSPNEAEASTSSTAARTSEDSSNEGADAGPDDPFNLFWVPANVHPELAPSEFKAFLQEHARVDGNTPALSRANSVSSTLDRKRSMLSRQYKPRDNDGVEEEHIVPRRASRYDLDGPHLTISDLQKLEELAEEASKGGDPSKLRSVIRRSLSMNVSPSYADQLDGIPEPPDDDSPIIVPRPNQILRRTARTKIRKSGQSDDGHGTGAHHFNARRRRAPAPRPGQPDLPTPPSDTSSSDHGDQSVESEPTPRVSPFQPEKRDDSDLKADRRITYTEESLIYDAYADEPEEPQEKPTSPSPSPVQRSPSPPPPVPPVPPVPDVPPVLHHPQPHHVSSHITQPPLSSPRSPSPDTSVTSHDSRRQEPPAFLSTSPPGSEKRKGKDKKGLLGKWGGDKSTKKNGKEKEKEPGFFGSLFGGKKKQEEPPHTLGHGSGPATAAALLGGSKSAKQYQPPVSPQPVDAYSRYPIHVERAIYRLSHIKLANPRRPLYEQVLISNLMFWYLGVINKAQQNNGTAAGAQNGTIAAPNALGLPNGSATAEAVNGEKERGEREPPDRVSKEREKAERERAEKERMEKERIEREKERERMEQKKDARRGTLTKPAAPGAPGTGARRAETPVKGPHYGLQHQAMEQEYAASGVPGSIPMARTNSAPSSPSAQPGANYPPGYAPQRPHTQPGPRQQPPPSIQPGMYFPHDQHHPPPNNAHHGHGQSQSVEFHHPRQQMQGGSQPQRPSSAGTGSSRAGPTNLPPGAMQPLPMAGGPDQSWLGVQGQMSAPPQFGQYGTDAGGYDRRPSLPSTAQYPTNQDWYAGSGAGGKLPGRSLSANAVPATAPANMNLNQQQPNGHAHLRKKNASPPGGYYPQGQPPPGSSHTRMRMQGAPVANGEEEDMPLAVWQQQRRK